MRQHLQVVLAFIVVLGGGYLGYLHLFEEDAAIPSLVVLEVEGSAIRTRSISGDSPLSVGSQLEEQDGLQVGPDGRVVLGLGEGTRVQIDADTRIQVIGVDPDGVRIELGEGRVQAKVQLGNAPVEIAHGPQSARVQEGAFSMTAADDGLLVRAQEGAVDLEGFEELSELAAGSYAFSAPGEPVISADEAKALLLHIQWPDGDTQRESAVGVAGQTLPHASLRARAGRTEVELRADAEGHFELQVPLEEGSNTVQVEATDPLGRTVVESRAYRVDSTPPAALETEINWND